MSRFLHKMTQTNKKRSIHLLELFVIFFLGLVFLYGNIHGHSIYILDEAKNAQCAKEMYLNKEWIVPTFNGELRTDKPVLHYYFMKLGYFLFGVNPLGARSFSVLMGALTLVLTYAFGKRHLGENIAQSAVFSLLCSMGFMLQFHLSVPDPYLVFFFSLSLFSYFHFQETNKKNYLLVAYASAGFATLTKGPIAIVLPILIVLLHQFNLGFNWKKLRNLLPLKGLLLFFLIVFPWYYLVHVKTNGAFTKSFFLEHNLHRFSETKEGHGGFFLLAFLFAITSALPFSLLSFNNFIKNTKNKHNLLYFSYLVVFSVLGFFTFSRTILPSYTSLLFPFLALILGKNLLDLISNKKTWPLYLFSALGALLFFGTYFGLSLSPAPLNQLDHLALCFFPTLLSIPFVFFWLKKEQFRTAYISSGLGFLFSLQALFYFGFPAIDQETAVIKSRKHLDKDIDIVYYKRFNASFSFYNDQEIEKYESISDLQKKIDQSSELYIITRKKYKEEYLQLKSLELVGEFPDVLEIFTTVILKKNPH